MTRDPRPLLAALSPRRDEQARALGTTPRTIQRWLSGQRSIGEPTWRLLIALTEKTKSDRGADS